MARRERKITEGIKVTFYIPKELHDQFKEMANKSGVPMTVLFRTAIKEYLDKQSVKNSS